MDGDGAVRAIPAIFAKFAGGVSLELVVAAALASFFAAHAMVITGRAGPALTLLATVVTVVTIDTLAFALLLCKVVLKQDMQK